MTTEYFSQTLPQASASSATIPSTLKIGLQEFQDPLQRPLWDRNLKNYAKKRRIQGVCQAQRYRSPKDAVIHVVLLLLNSTDQFREIRKIAAEIANYSDMMRRVFKEANFLVIESTKNT